MQPVSSQSGSTTVSRGYHTTEQPPRRPHSSSGGKRGKVNVEGKPPHSVSGKRDTTSQTKENTPDYYTQAFDENVKMIQRLEKTMTLIPLVNGQPSQDRTQITACALHHLSKGARYPLYPDDKIDSLQLPYAFYRPNDKTGYYRSSGGSIINIYEEHVLRRFGVDKGRLAGEDFIAVIKTKKLKRLMKGTFQWVHANNSSDYMEFSAKTPTASDNKTCMGELRASLQKIADAKTSQENVFLDVSRIINIAPDHVLSPEEVRTRCNEIRQAIKNFKDLKGAKVGGFVKLQDGQWAFILFTSPFQNKTERLDDFQRRFFQVQALGYKPDFMEIKNALAAQGYNFNLLKREYCREYPKLGVPAPDKILIKPEELKQYATNIVERDINGLLTEILKKFQNEDNQGKANTLKMLHTFFRITVSKIQVSPDQPHKVAIVKDSLNQILELLMTLKKSPKNNHIVFLKTVDLIMEEIILMQLSTPATADLKGKIKKLGTIASNQGTLTPHVELYTSGMNAFSQLIMAHCKSVDVQPRPPLKVYCSSNCYYELNSVMGTNFKNHGEWRSEVNFEKNMNVDEPDVIIGDLYPNNARAAKTTKIDYLSALPPKDIIAKRKNRPLTLAIDTSTSSLNDPRLLEIISKYKEAIDAGALNLVVISSLAKFTQTGFDKHNGGVILRYNNNSDRFTALNTRMAKYASEEPMTITAQKYFELFFETGQEINDFVVSIRKKTHIMHKFLKGEDSEGFSTVKAKKTVMHVGERDPETPFIGIQFAEAIHSLSLDYSLRDKLKQVVPVLMQEYLVLKAHAQGLPLNKRSSFPFNHTNVNVCLDSLRMTVGIEDDKTLETYSKLISEASTQFNLLLANPKNNDLICEFATLLSSEKEIDKVLSNQESYAFIIEEFRKKPTIEQLMQSILTRYSMAQERIKPRLTKF